MHVALGHLLRLDGREALLWNIAADIIINEMLMAENMELPDGTLNFESIPPEVNLSKRDFQLETTETLYDKLLTYAEKMRDKKNFDEHLKSGGDGPCKDNKPLTEEQKRFLKKEWQRKMVDAAKQTEMSRGNVPGYVQKLVDKLTNPQLNWFSMLHKYITNELPIDQTYRRPGRRTYGTGIYMPSTLRENLEITVTLDLSGSISQSDYAKFISELYGMLNSFQQVDATLLYWDTEVRGTLKVSSHNKRKAVENIVQAGGGTTFNCLEPYMKANNIKSKLNIHLTDGYIESDINLPNGTNIFVLTSDGMDVEKFKVHGNLQNVAKLTK